MNNKEKEAAERLRRLADKNFKTDFNVSISYSDTGQRPGEKELEEVEKFTKKFRQGVE